MNKKSTEEVIVLAKSALKSALLLDPRCEHNYTFRGGSIWTICDECGKEWADDEGGFKPDPPHPVILKIEEALDAIESREENQKELKYKSMADDEKSRNPEMSDERYTYMLNEEIKDLKKKCERLEVERAKYFSLSMSYAFDKKELKKQPSVDRLVDLANSLGWDGVNNSKLLHVFIENYIIELKEQVEHLKKQPFIDYRSLTYGQMADIVKQIHMEIKDRNSIGINFYAGYVENAYNALRVISEGEAENFTSESGPRE